MELLKELGISGGTAIILLIVSYWVIKGAVKNGVIAAFEEIRQGHAEKASQGKVYERGSG